MLAGALRPTTPTNFRSQAGNCILITIAVVCVCILVACGVLIVREYSLSSSYVDTMCTLGNVTYKPPRLPCQHCSTKAKSKVKGKDICDESWFPCLQLEVKYRTSEGYPKEGVLHTDSLQARGEFGQCSYDICLKSFKENRENIEQYASGWRSKGKSPFKCFYHQNNHRLLIAEKKHTKTDVIHSMFWPSLVIVICGIIFLRMEMKRRKLTCCGKEETAVENKVTAENKMYEKVATVESPYEADFYKRHEKRLSCSDAHIGEIRRYSHPNTVCNESSSQSLTNLHHCGTLPHGHVGNDLKQNSSKCDKRDGGSEHKSKTQNATSNGGGGGGGGSAKKNVMTSLPDAKRSKLNNLKNSLKPKSHVNVPKIVIDPDTGSQSADSHDETHV